jgi:hypothetical protein
MKNAAAAQRRVVDILRFKVRSGGVTDFNGVIIGDSHTGSNRK